MMGRTIKLPPSSGSLDGVDDDADREHEAKQRKRVEGEAMFNRTISCISRDSI
jgi:hypothetical protein